MQWLDEMCYPYRRTPRRDSELLNHGEDDASEFFRCTPKTTVAFFYFRWNSTHVTILRRRTINKPYRAACKCY